MRLLSFLFAFLLVWPVSHSLAQTTKIFVASTGNDANDGSRLSPKRNFQPAHDAVVAGGQIVVLDTAGYGALAINKSLAITVPPGVNGFVTIANVNLNGITINAGTSDVVSLRGLIVEGPSAEAGSGTGILSNQVGTLRVEDCTVRSFPVGIRVTGGTAARLSVQGGSVRDVTNGVLMENSSTDIAKEGVVTDCALDGALGNGLYAFSGLSNSTVKLTATRCTLTHCQSAAYAANSGTTIYLDDCVVSGNTTGVVVGTNGLLTTRSNNTFTNNTTDGTFTGTLSAK